MHNDFRYIKSGEDGNDWIVFISDKQPLVKDNGANQLFDEPNPYFQQQLKIMQWTGLKDRNGIEIYEDDIVSNSMIKGRVSYNHFSFVVYDKNTDYIFLYKLANNTLEVVGNIYENKELFND